MQISDKPLGLKQLTVFMQLGWCCFVIAINIKFMETSIQKDPVAENPVDRGFYERLITRHEMLTQITAFLTFLVSIKIVKYTDLNRPMTIMYLSVGKVKQQTNCFRHCCW